MRVLIAPDDFKGTLSAVEAARAIAVGWHSAAPDDELLLAPLSDGGPGFVSVIEQARGGEIVPVVVRGPLGAAVAAEFLMDGNTAYVESAQACGLAVSSERRPLEATTYGVGEILRAAVDRGARVIVIGLGGSATTDAGAGMLAALGARAWDDVGDPVPLDQGGQALGRSARADLAPAVDLLSGVEIVIASDVDSALLGPHGAARGFGPQKGALPAEVDLLEESLGSWSAAIAPTADGGDLALIPGAGAAGGLGFGLLLLGGTRVPGIQTVIDRVGLVDHIARVDLVVTGEGCFDWQSLRGKAVAGVAAAALAQGRPALVIAGRVEVGRRDHAALGITSAYAVEGKGVPADDLALCAARVARQWSR